MDLGQYVDEARGRQMELAAALECDPQLVWQWARRRRPVPVARCGPIERATGGLVRRWALRPDDWFVHWPELVGAAGAPPAEVVPA